MNKLSVLVAVVTGLGGGLTGFGVASYSAGRQLAVLDEIKPALQQLQRHDRQLTVAGATCCPEVRQVAQAPRGMTLVAELLHGAAAVATR